MLKAVCFFQRALSVTSEDTMTGPAGAMGELHPAHYQEQGTAAFSRYTPPSAPLIPSISESLNRDLPRRTP